MYVKIEVERLITLVLIRKNPIVEECAEQSKAIAVINRTRFFTIIS